MKRNILLIIAMVLGVAYAAYSLVYWSGASSGNGSTAADAGAAIATMLVMPHLVCTLIAALFNVFAVVFNKYGFALVAGILYAVAMVLFPAYFFFVIIQMILCFVAYAQMKKQANAPSR